MHLRICLMKRDTPFSCSGGVFARRAIFVPSILTLGGPQARAVQLFERLAVLETHTLRY